MPFITDLQLTRRDQNNQIVEYYQIGVGCIDVKYDIAGKTYEILEVTAAHTIYFSAVQGSKRVDYIARRGEHFFADLNMDQTRELEIRHDELLLA